MQKLHVYGHPRLPSIGTILNSGAFWSVGSMNFQRARTPGRDTGCVSAVTWRPSGRCGWQSSRTPLSTALSVNPNT